MGPPLQTCSNTSIFFMRSSVVYQYSSTRISGGGATRSDRVRMRNRKRRKSRDVVTGSMFCAYSNTKCSTVIQVPGLPGVTEGHVTPKGSTWVKCAHAQPGSGAIFALVKTFQR